MTKRLCVVSAKGHVNCWLIDDHDGDHYDSVLGIYWYKREGSGVREPSGDKDGDELAARRRLYRDRREEEAPSTLAWSA